MRSGMQCPPSSISYERNSIQGCASCSGIFVFVYIHPYMDGNGRMGRFLMNVMMAAGGYPWTVVPLSARNIYMAALEKASVGEDIALFAEFLAGLARNGLAGEPLPPVPKA